MTVYIVQKIFSTARKTDENIDMVFDSEEKAWNRIEKLYYTFIDVLSSLEDKYFAGIMRVNIKDSGVMLIFGINGVKRYVIYRIIKRNINERILGV